MIPITMLSSDELDQDTSRAEKAANDGPVFITELGKSTHVLLSFEEYQRITAGERSLVRDVLER